MRTRVLSHSRYITDPFFWYEIGQTGIEPQWYGPNAPKMGELTPQAVEDAIERRTLPDGTRSRQGVGPKGYELINMPHISVAIAMSVISSAVNSKAFLEAQSVANEVSLKPFFDEGFYAKKSAKGHDYIKVDALFMIFPNLHNRAGGFHPHTHNVLVRPSVDETGKARNVDGQTVFNRALSDAYYQKTLDEHCQSWGLRTGFNKGKLIVTDIPQHVIDALSIRTQQINEWIREKGVENTRFNRQLGAWETASPKQNFKHPERMALMRLECEKLGLTVEHVMHKKEAPSDMLKSWHAAHAVKDAIAEIGAAQTVFTKQDLIAAAINKSIGTPATLGNVLEDVKARLLEPKRFGMIELEGKGYVLESQIEKAKKLVATIQDNVKQEAPVKQEAVKEQPEELQKEEVKRYASIKVTTDNEPFVNVREDSLEAYIHATTKPSYWSRHWEAAKHAFGQSIGSIHKRIFEAEQVFKSKRYAEKKILPHTVIEVHNGGAAKLEDLKLIIDRAEKHKARVKIFANEEEIKRIGEALEREGRLRAYTLTITR
jgi:hypothetical protein